MSVNCGNAGPWTGCGSTWRGRWARLTNPPRRCSGSPTSPCSSGAHAETLFGGVVVYSEAPRPGNSCKVSKQLSKSARQIVIGHSNGCMTMLRWGIGAGVYPNIITHSVTGIEQ